MATNNFNLYGKVVINQFYAKSEEEEEVKEVKDTKKKETLSENAPPIEPEDAPPEDPPPSTPEKLGISLLRTPSQRSLLKTPSQRSLLRPSPSTPVRSLSSPSTTERSLLPPSTPVRYLSSPSTAVRFLQLPSTPVRSPPSTSTGVRSLPPPSRTLRFLPPSSTAVRSLRPPSRALRFPPPSSRAVRFIPPSSSAVRYLASPSTPVRFLQLPSTPVRSPPSTSTGVRFLPPPCTADYTPSKAVATQLNLATICSPSTSTKRPRRTGSPPGVRQLLFMSPPSPESPESSESSPDSQPRQSVTINISPRSHLRCPRCRHKLDTSNQLYEHLLTCELAGKQEKCDFCEYRTSSSRGKKTHQGQCKRNPAVINRLETARVYKCMFCGQSFSGEGAKKKHCKGWVDCDVYTFR